MSTEIFTAKERTERKFTVSAPVYTPFYNKWGANVYWQTDKFDFDPLNLDANSTPGSPVLIAQELFIGFLNAVGGRFVFDGVRTLTLIVEPGQTVIINEQCNPYEIWKEYNTHFPKAAHEEKFWELLEFCTWVEQSKTAHFSGKSNYDVFNEELVYDYLRRIEKMNLPKGKFTIDEGWCERRLPDKRYATGNYIADRDKFPHFEKMIKDITDEGYTPGLWFSPFIAAPDADIAKKCPNILKKAEESGRKQFFINPEEEALLHSYYHDVFATYIEMGIRKLKIDIAYSKMSDMISLLRILSEEVRKIDNTVEIECHMPNILANPYCDTVRLNDVSVDRSDWRSVTLGHFDVCRRSAPDKILNLDHIGSNAAAPGANAFMEHWHMLRSFLAETRSYVVVSDLPDIFTKDVCDRFCDELRDVYSQDGFRKQ